MGPVRRLVDKLQVGELGGVRPDAAGGRNLIEVAEKEQPFALIADVAEF